VVNHLLPDEDFETLELLYRHIYQTNVISIGETLFPPLPNLTVLIFKNTVKLLNTRFHSTINSGFEPLHCIKNFGDTYFKETRTALVP
jgi:hypothetical protein